MNFSEEESEYIVDDLAEVIGKLAYMATDDDADRFIVHGGKEKGRDYDEVQPPAEINNKLTYLATEGDDHFIVYGDKEIGRQYDSASYPTEVDNSLAYWANSGNEEFVVYENQELGRKYDDAGYPAGVSGSLAYWASDGNEEFVVYENQEGKKYDSVSPDSLTEVNGNLAYSAKENDQRFVVYNGQEVGKKYYSAYSPTEVNGNLTYVASDTEKEGGQFVVYGNQEVGKKYDSAFSPTEVNGKLAYVARDGDQWLVVHNGREGKRYNRIEPPSVTEIGGRLTYMFVTPDYDSFLVSQGQEIGLNYDEVRSFTGVDDKLVFSAKKDDQWYILWEMDSDERECLDAGGSWTQFPNSCVDSCAYRRGEQENCLQALTMGCDCGSNMCFNGTDCVVTEVDSEERECLDAGGSWVEFSNSCVDSCAYRRGEQEDCLQALTMGCDCGSNMCFNGTDCVMIN